MNIIDQNFYQLIRFLNTQSEDMLFETIKRHYLNLSPELHQSLEDYFQKFDYWGSLNAEKNDFDHIHQRANVLFHHLDDFVHLYERLEDYRSKKLLFAILNNWYQFDFITLGNALEKNYSPYFDLDIVPTAEEEVFVDLGAYTGDTILDYLNVYGVDSYKKIYGYEITEETFQKLQKNLRFYPNIILKNNAVIDQNQTVFIEPSTVDASANTVRDYGATKIEAVTLDEDIKEPITMLKMDIEGSEQKAIIGAINHIKKDTPNLFLSVYHSFEDMWKIPHMIDEIKPGYQFYLRTHGNNIFATEVTLIAIYPKK